MEKVNNTPQEILEKIKDSNKIVTFLDGRFDLDSLCSSLVVKQVVESLGKQIDICAEHVISTKNIPNDFSTTDFIHGGVDPAVFDFSKYDLIIYLDTMDAKKISSKADYVPSTETFSINIDHHKDNTFFGNLNYVFPEASSTCTLLFDLTKQMGLELTETSKKYITYGMLTDTGFFRQANTKIEDFELATSFMKEGIDIPKIIRELKNTISMDSVKFNKILYKNLVVDSKNKIAYSSISQAEIKESKINLDNVIDNFVEVIRNIEDIVFAVVIKEKKEPGRYNMALRSHQEDFDVSVIAAKVGGGGHKNAAGCQVRDCTSMEEAYNTVLNAYIQIYNQSS